MIRFIIGTIVFLGILALGYVAFGIDPTWKEMILVVVAMAISDIVEEAL